MYCSALLSGSSGDVDGGGGYASRGMYGKSQYLPLNFAVNLKML